MVAEQLAGQKPHINYLLIPGVVYTWPEVASVGFTEEQLKADGRAYKTGNFPYKALGRARASMDLDGFVKILADKNTRHIPVIGISAYASPQSIKQAMHMGMVGFIAKPIDHKQFIARVRAFLLPGTEK